MTLEQLRKNPTFVESWRKIMESQRFAPIWEMLNETHPMKKTTSQIMLSMEASSNYMHYIQGYELALERMRAAAQPLTMAEQLPEPTFERPEVEEQ